MDIAGVIEGFYGEPWTWEQRRSLVDWCVPRGMADYVYAPKDDPLHRSAWRVPYEADDLDGLARVASAPDSRVWFALSPGLSIDYDSADDRAAVRDKFETALDCGVHGFVLAVDDIAPRPGLGAAHGRLVAWLLDAVERPLLLVPTDYTSTHETTYLRELADSCPPEVPIGWTGTTVVCDEITPAQAQARADALGGRRPWLWDNYPVNDGLMNDRLFLGPLRGRPLELRDHLCGYLANGANQPLASRIALASIAGWLADGDAEGAWGRHVTDAGLRVFAEACDGAHPNRLVDAVLAGADGAVEEAIAWFGAAAETGATGLGEEADAWLEQCHREATIAVATLERLEADDLATADAEHLSAAVIVPWVVARRSRVTVFGPRRSMRPLFAQDDLGGFVARRGVVDDDQNAVDRLVRYALDRLPA